MNIFQTILPLLQVDSVSNSTGQVESQYVEKSILEIILMGGWAMIPLALLLIVAIYIFIERYMTIKKSNSKPETFMSQVKAYVLSGEVEKAKTVCESNNSPFSKMILKGLNRLGSPLTDISASIENVAKLEIQRLEKSLSFLATVAGAAPMVGFFGTVVGMIKAFMEISFLKGNVNPAVLADGIYQAMITTAGGLAVGIIAYLGYNTLVNMVNSVVFKMETTSTDFIDLLQEPAS